MKKLLQTCTEFLPLVLFFIFFKYYGIIVATKVVVLASVVMLILNYLVNKTMPALTLISVAFLIIFGGLTILTRDPRIIKIKPTIVNGIFFLILLAGIVSKKPFLQKLLGQKIKFKDEKTWHSLALRFALFFLAIAVLNEIIWRNFSDETWVWFKTFGIIILNLIFIASQMRFIINNQIKEKP